MQFKSLHVTFHKTTKKGFKAAFMRWQSKGPVTGTYVAGPIGGFFVRGFGRRFMFHSDNPWTKWPVSPEVRVRHKGRG